MKRRDFVAGGTLLGAALAMPAAWAQARPAANPLAPNPAEFKRNYASFVGKARVLEEGLKFDMPVLADNPGAVPVGVVLTTPLTETRYCTELIILAELNPVPLACRFAFSPLSGTTEIAVRLRLAQTQTLHALARMSDGRVLGARQAVTVAASGCGM
ncbi:MAG: thiosulfate oxidation carrier protein SoxY [Zoogloea sp.]|uniref:thiosulfate oxidation carrier protein SoxY n=1 Tax=Zoogloea sp. TaxID=49181 RepID=UPI002606F570|nr:thiosulfate oxidation carrier protein SoxY [Zoogloea sp.]MDD3327845.1 thiosulfate oxidation carrier protein SoxY [Zoogloea sp.]